MKSVDCPSAPYGRRFAARKIRKNVAIPVDSPCGNDYADLVGPKIVVPCSPRRIKCYDDRCASFLRYVLWGATGRIDNLVIPKSAVDFIDIDAFVEALALFFRQIRQT
jgi:hypothetical protein